MHTDVHHGPSTLYAESINLYLLCREYLYVILTLQQNHGASKGELLQGVEVCCGVIRGRGSAVS
jgi:hypothetical protein